MLGAIESLLSAVVADGMAGTRHNSNQELIGQGIANVAVPFFGGFAATGAIARTATSIRNGGSSPLAGIVHAATLVLIIVLMAPLAWLAASWPALGRAGISGVGLAPGVLALTLYSLLPVVRGTLAGLAQVPSAVTQAALGLGFSPAQLFWQAQVPLALPVVLGGIRTASIQAVGLAAVTALIGAGGLGSLMFEGLFSSAQDLVLLGVVPIVVLGALVDGVFKLLIGLTRPATTPLEIAQ